MKKLHPLTVCALVAPALTLGMSSALAQDQSTSRDTSQEIQQQRTSPGQAQDPRTTPGQSTEPRTYPGATPGTTTRPQPGTAPGREGTTPGQQGTTPGQQGTTPGQQGTTPGQDRSAAADRAKHHDKAHLASMPQDAFRADDLMGKELKSRQNDERIGSVSDLIIDNDGQIVAVVVEVGEFLGMGEKEVAIPWDSVERTARAGEAGHEFRVTASRDTLRDAPEFKKEGKEAKRY
jgi:sporulation protein YlmC with PRC-barrel domain